MAKNILLLVANQLCICWLASAVAFGCKTCSKKTLKNLDCKLHTYFAALIPAKPNWADTTFINSGSPEFLQSKGMKMSLLL